MANLQDIIPAFFTGPNGEQLTPDQITQRQQVAKSLLSRATDTSPDAGGWASVLNKALMGGMAGYDMRTADDAAALNAETDQANIEAGLGSIFGGGQTPAGSIGGAFPSAVAQGASPTSGVATPTSGVATPTSGVATGTVTNIPQAPEIRQGLIDRGLQPHIADAFILNFQDESGLNPGINEAKPLVPGSRGGYGLYQLTGPRRREYEAFAAQRGVPLDSADAQLDFLMNELQGSEAGAAKSILSAPDTATAAQAIVNNFLRPAPEHRQARSSRYASAPNTAIEAIENIAPVDGGDDVVFDQEDFSNRFGDVQTDQVAIVEPSMQQQQPQIDPRLAAFNDQMLGGALSETGRSEVAQALTGYFPDAPGQAQNNAMSQAPMQQQTGGVNPQIIASLLGPNSSPQARQVGALLIGQHQQQQAAMQAQQQAQQELAQRQQVAQSMGIDPNVAIDPEAWKAALAKANRDRSTVTVGNTVIDANTMQPIYEGTPENPTSVQEYEYGVRNPEYFERQESLKRAGATNIDNRQMGSVPAGYQVQYDEQGRPVSMAPIPGSPDDLKNKAAIDAAGASEDSKRRIAEVVTQDIDRAMDLIEKSPFSTTGVAGSAISRIGGTSANDVANLINTIQANAGFDRLQAMRDASPTGGALGSISERELTYLQSTIGSLEQSQSKEQLIRNLKRVKRAYSDIIDGPSSGDNVPISEMSDEELEALANGN